MINFCNRVSTLYWPVMHVNSEKIFFLIFGSVLKPTNGIYLLHRNALQDHVLKNSTQYWFSYIRAFLWSKIRANQKAGEFTLLSSSVWHAARTTETFHHHTMKPTMISINTKRCETSCSSEAHGKARKSDSCVFASLGKEMSRGYCTSLFTS